jgi:hypothetical protein
MEILGSDGRARYSKRWLDRVFGSTQAIGRRDETSAVALTTLYAWWAGVRADPSSCNHYGADLVEQAIGVLELAVNDRHDPFLVNMEDGEKHQ